MESVPTAWAVRTETEAEVPTGHAQPVQRGAGLRTYLAPKLPAGPIVASRTPAVRLRSLVGPRQRTAAKTIGTRLMAPRSRRRFQELLGGGPLLLNLGSGTYNAPGWVNIDLWGLHAAWGVQPDVIWDLRRPLPLPDGSVDAVFLEHVLEHLPAPVGLAAVDQAFRLLRPGGVLRISVPDFGRYAREYAARKTAPTAPGVIDAVRPGRPTDLLALAEVVYDHGHVSIWDDETLVVLLEAAGFTDVAPSGFGAGRVGPSPDSPQRQPESVYVEGVRPA
ncbi:class I SAM-dependent methyltransferase [Klenkia terrae]|uniref:Methyltransferase domain-containing protein n=1 Tax=Klenkia terrae TaxID=1052259 RepID=A0ABU8E453_9ACTN|nr:methyltransferase domain-containing protein [Klenkia terrae]